MTKKLIWTLIISSIFINVSYAKITNNTSQYSQQPVSANYSSSATPAFLQSLTRHWWFHPLLTFSFGSSVAKVGESLNYSPVDLCFYDYKPNDAYSDTLLLGLFVGTEIPLRSPQWNLDAGIGYYHHNNLEMEGTLTQGADAASASTYQYNYQVRSNQLLAEGKLLWKLKEKIRPYFSLGIGAAFNDVHGYNTNVPYYLEYTPSYNDHSQSNFSYAIGLGFDMDVFKQWRLGAGYRFSDLGRANLGSGMLDTVALSTTLKQQHLYDHQIQFQITYIPLFN